MRSALAVAVELHGTASDSAVSRLLWNASGAIPKVTPGSRDTGDTPTRRVAKSLEDRGAEDDGDDLTVASSGRPATWSVVSRVYLDPGVLLVPSGADTTAGSRVAADAAEALSNLAETGHELVLVTSERVTLPDGFPEIRKSPRIDPAPATSWFLTTDPDLCGRRQAGLRTVLVGPGPSTHRAAIQRCDIQTRDLNAAVIEILMREAMASVG
jgi:hypothetical protein